MDTYQGKIGSISPAIGPYEMQIYMNLDKEPAAPPVTGGVTGTGTLLPISWSVGYTGIVGTNFTNAKHGY